MLPVNRCSRNMAAQYKIDYDGHSVMAAFFDYDRDGDLDLIHFGESKTYQRSDELPAEDNGWVSRQ